MELECFNLQFVSQASSKWLPEWTRKETPLGAEAVPIAKPDPDAVGRFVRKHFAGPAFLLKFDGGLHKVGFVLYAPSGEMIHAFGRTDPIKFHSNNTAELGALEEALSFLVSPDGLDLLGRYPEATHLLV